MRGRTILYVAAGVALGLAAGLFFDQVPLHLGLGFFVGIAAASIDRRRRD